MATNAERAPTKLGIKSFDDIAKFKDQLDGKIYGIEPGNDGNRLILDMIEKDTFGLKGFEVVESSEAGYACRQVARGSPKQGRTCCLSRLGTASDERQLRDGLS